MTLRYKVWKSDTKSWESMLQTATEWVNKGLRQNSLRPEHIVNIMMDSQGAARGALGTLAIVYWSDPSCNYDSEYFGNSVLV